MAKGVYLRNRIFAGGVDLTGVSSKMAFKTKTDFEDDTNFGSDAGKEYLPGLMSCAMEADGGWEAGDSSKVDNSRFAAIGGTTAWTVFHALNSTAAASAGVGDSCYFSSFLDVDYNCFGEVGKRAPWSATAVGKLPPVKGIGLHPPGTARTTTGTGTITQHIAVAAGQKLYANLHVLSVAGTATPTITARVESDSAVGFPSPVTVGTFAAKTAIGGETISVAGPNTDAWYRAAWTISGTSPSFLFVVVIGVK